MNEDSYFDADAVEKPTSAGQFASVDAVETFELLPGLDFGPVVGERTLSNFVRFAPHTSAPRHAHAEEQVVIMLDGELYFEIDGDVRRMSRGDIAVVPPWVPHGAHTRDAGCLEVDIFSPPRQALLDRIIGKLDRVSQPQP